MTNGEIVAFLIVYLLGIVACAYVAGRRGFAAGGAACGVFLGPLLGLIAAWFLSRRGAADQPR